MAGIYIHIPYCKQACHYCDFHFSTQVSSMQAMTQALVDELHLRKTYLNEPVQTIYFGGGTPSMLSDEALSTLLNTIGNLFQVEPNAEITLEANPDDLSKDRLRAFRNLGINRLSIGIQSFDDKILTVLNRAHSSLSAVKSFELARQEGFNNISIDLIYAIPHQGIDLWKQNILKACALGADHISSYSLTIEEKTVFGRWFEKGKLEVVSDDAAAEQLEFLIDELSRHGYEQYEVSNFSKPGFISQHNSSYWKRKHYLGIGPSAHSYNGVSRQYNINNNALYINGIKEGKLNHTYELLTREDQINDYILTSLRTSWGIDLKFLLDTFQYDIEKQYDSYLHQLFNQQLAIFKEDHLVLTTKGRLLADKISTDLFLITT
jgi:oxygen-independent coproporphyrinogen-3 oxidase